MKNYFIYAIVSVAGAVILGLEILGTRVLGPFYGVSIYLWSALISVTLAALSIGYIAGGKLADARASVTRVGVILVFAGLWILLIPWLKHPILNLTEPAGLRLAVLITATILFFPPLMLLGMINPFAIKLKADSLTTLGVTSGTLNAISTLASVISALLTGYILIPNFGVTVLLYSFGILLFLVGGIVFVFEKKMKHLTGTTLAVVLAFGLLWVSESGQNRHTDTLLTLEHSPYSELRVLDIADERYLLNDGGIHSRTDTVVWESTLHYCAVMDLAKNFFDSTGTMLNIGLGGGSLVKQYRHHGWHVDAVEIDPVVVNLAKDYFALYPSDGTIYEMDGRKFLESTSKMYDIILLDAFGSSSIPFHLCTKEAFALAAKRLTSDGILAVNIQALGWYDPMVNAFGATLKSVFKEVLVLPMEEPPSVVGNIVLFASNRAFIPKRLPPDNVVLSPDWRYGPGYQKVHAWDNRFVPNTSAASIMTDEYNPMELRWETINYEVRKQLHEYFAQYKVHESW